MKLTYLTFDCLEYVLDYLDLTDLVNVADSTKQLNRAARLVFMRKYGDWAVTFSDIKMAADQPFEITGGEIECKTLKASLQLLRCVGPVVSKITFNGGQIREQDIDNVSEIIYKLFTYINNYCAEYLKELSIASSLVAGPNYREYCSIDLLEYFEKPFENLIRLEIDNNNFTAKKCLARIFPKLQHMKISTNKNETFYKINTMHFPYLDNLEILQCGGNEDKLLPDFLRLNPQLKELSLRSAYYSSKLNANLFRCAVKSLQNIETFRLSYMKTTQVRGDFISMRNVKSFEIVLCALEELPVYFLPFSFQQLKKFYINFPQKQLCVPFVEEFFEFIGRHPTITHLYIRGSNTVMTKNFNWSRLAKSLSSLVEIEIPNFFSAGEAFDIVAKFKSLKRFYFRSCENSDSFQTRFGGKWKVKTTGFDRYNQAKITVELKRRI